MLEFLSSTRMLKVEKLSFLPDPSCLLVQETRASELKGP